MIQIPNEEFARWLLVLAFLSEAYEDDELIAIADEMLDEYCFQTGELGDICK